MKACDAVVIFNILSYCKHFSDDQIDFFHWYLGYFSALDNYNVALTDTDIEFVKGYKEYLPKPFEWNGHHIVNPYLDETGRFEVNPEKYYGWQP